MRRKIIRIDEEKCNGCGQCVTACAEGAIAIVDGKARLVSETYCDGLGNCLGTCPEDAITIEEREADAFDEKAVEAHLGKGSSSEEPFTCPGSMVRELKRDAGSGQAETRGASTSELSQWPVQLALVPPSAPCFRNADLLLVADCVPFAYADFHAKFLRGRPVAVGCPKLDDGEMYVEKLAQIVGQAAVKSVTVVRMEVPCCGGLAVIAEKAMERSGRDVPVKTIVVGIEGGILTEE